MRRLQAQLHELSLFNHGFARDGEELFDNPVDARLGAWRILEHPASAPGQQSVGQVRQQDQCLLSSQAMVAPAVALEAPLRSLQLGFYRRTVVIGHKERARVW